MAKYAQIDEAGLCFAISELAEPIENPAMVSLAEGEFPMGHTYVDGAWTAPAPAPPVPLSLTHLQFIEHAQDAGEMSDAALVAAKLDPNLTAFWIRFELATSLERDHPTTVQGLAALVMTGHLSEEGQEAILELWPAA